MGIQVVKWDTRGCHPPTPRALVVVQVSSPPAASTAVRSLCSYISHPTITPSLSLLWSLYWSLLSTGLSLAAYYCSLVPVYWRLTTGLACCLLGLAARWLLAAYCCRAASHWSLLLAARWLASHDQWFLASPVQQLLLLLVTRC